MLIVGILISISSLDDLFIDLLALRISRRKPKDPLAQLPARSLELPPISFGIFVANWQEHDVLGRMVAGNLARLSHRPLRLYLGVYPNDTETLRVAEALAAAHPGNIEVIVNALEGPTSKGQMLNEMFARVYAEPAQAPDLIILHDSEDVIDPRSLPVFASFSSDFDYIQIPVFSLEAGGRSLVAGTYMEEFAERHTGEMLVRDSVGASIPSAGVGTCLSRRLICHMLAHRGHVLMPGCVTEDYILGVEAHRAGFKSTFAAIQQDAPSGAVVDAIVATREYFPRYFWASIRQKTRWTYGIAFEATRKLGWRGNAWDVYFFCRDRKGVIANLLPALSAILMLLFLLASFDGTEVPDFFWKPFSFVVYLNSMAIAWRLWIRVSAFKEVHGRYDPVWVAIRWLVAIVVNAVAVLRAWQLFLGPSRFATLPVVWSKTRHELPDDFGGESPEATAHSPHVRVLGVSK
jgi:bacteriophage N4 adsorption protein B